MTLAECLTEFAARLEFAREPDGRGSAARPLEPGAIVAKFRDNARRALPADRVAALEKVRCRSTRSTPWGRSWARAASDRACRNLALSRSVIAGLAIGVASAG